MLLGPIQRLRFWSTLFPYFVSEEEQAIRNADMCLQSVPIRWLRRVQVLPREERKNRHGANTGNSIIAEAAKMTVCGSDTTFSSEEAQEQAVVSRYSPYIGIDATVTVIDTQDGPALEILSHQYTFVDYGSDTAPVEWNSILSSSPGRSGIYTDTNCTTMRKVIPFGQMEFATAGEEAEWEAIGLKRETKGFMIYKKTNMNGINPRYQHLYRQRHAPTTKPNTHKYQDKDRFVPSDSPQDSSNNSYIRVLACQLVPNSKLSLSRGEAIKHINTLIHGNKYGYESSFSNLINCGSSSSYDKNDNNEFNKQQQQQQQYEHKNFDESFDNNSFVAV